MVKLKKQAQIPETKTAKVQMDEILRHYSENGATNFKMINLKDVIIPNNLSKKHPKKQIKKLVLSIVKLGYSNPIIITDNNVLISGYCRILAAQELEMTEIPAVVLSNVTETDANALRLLDNRLAEDSEWNFSVLKSEIEKLLKLDFELEDVGFEPLDYDKLLYEEQEEKTTHEKEQDDASWLDANIPAIVKSGDLYRLGDHFVYCEDSLCEQSYEIVMQGETAQIVVTDPPYNCKINGFVCNTRHKEFAMASGEMSNEQFAGFLNTILKNLHNFSSDGSLHYIFIDWRGINTLLTEGLKTYSELLNILVWNKGISGQGALYRSQHELIPVFKKKGKHQNNIKLGKYGRYRTNILDYPGVRATNPASLELRKLHPTVKSVPLIHDLILDTSSQNDIVLDCFGGSGSTLIAAERCKRRARLIEIDPHYCDVIIYRWQKETGKTAKFVKNFKTKNGEI